MARLGVAFAILINIVAALGGAVAQEAFHLDRLDVDIEVRNNGDLWVTENHGYVFAGPTRSPRTHWLSTQDLDRIENVIVSAGIVFLNMKLTLETDGSGLPGLTSLARRRDGPSPSNTP